jgi:hypothetical protein
VAVVTMRGITTVLALWRAVVPVLTRRLPAELVGGRATELTSWRTAELTRRWSIVSTVITSSELRRSTPVARSGSSLVSAASVLLLISLTWIVVLWRRRALVPLIVALVVARTRLWGVVRRLIAAVSLVPLRRVVIELLHARGNVGRAVLVNVEFTPGVRATRAETLLPRLESQQCCNPDQLTIFPDKRS